MSARIYEIQTLHRVYDIAAANREQALAEHERLHPGEVVIDSKDKTRRREHERAREQRVGGRTD